MYEMKTQCYAMLLEQYGMGGGGQGKRGDNSTQGRRRTFTPVFIHLWDIRKDAAGRMPNTEPLIENSTRDAHTYTHKHTRMHTPVLVGMGARPSAVTFVPD